MIAYKRTQGRADVHVLALAVVAAMLLPLTAQAGDAGALLTKAVEKYQENEYRDALEAFHAYASLGRKNGELEAYQAKMVEDYGVTLGKTMASCRMMVTCRICKGDGGHDCKSCDGDGAVHRKKKKTVTSVSGKSISRHTVHWKEPRKCRKCGGSGYRFCKVCDGTGRSQVNPSRGKKLQLFDFERDHMAGMLERKGNFYFRQISVTTDGGLSRRTKTQPGQQPGQANDQNLADDGYQHGDLIDPGELDIKDLELAARASQFYKEATKIASSPATKMALQSKLRNTQTATSSFSKMLDRAWKQEAKDNKAKAFAAYR